METPTGYDEPAELGDGLLAVVFWDVVCPFQVGFAAGGGLPGGFEPNCCEYAADLEEAFGFFDGCEAWVG